MPQHFAHITGNEQVKQYLVRMVEKQAIANSLLFAGPSGIGKSLFALAFAKNLLNVDSDHHPDIHSYRPEGKIGMHSIDSMRQFSEEVYMAPFSAAWKVFIIHDADRMLTYSANALLKTFEEPAPKSIIIFLSSNPEALLPTLLSRCRTIRFHSIPREEIVALIQSKYNKSQPEAEVIAAQSKGSVGHAFRLAEQGGDPLRTLVLSILAREKISTYTQLIEAARSISEYIEQTRQAMEEETRSSLRSGYLEGISSIQQQAMEKEIDGALAMRLAREAESVFDVILSWYRDIHLLQVGGERAYLFHPDYTTQMENILLHGNVLALEIVQKAISQARLTLERSTPLHNCMENLFLQLNLI